MIDVCAAADAFRGDVRAAIVACAQPRSAPEGFFDSANFAFGQPLERSALEAAIQAVPGVAGVTCIRYRLRDRSTYLPKWATP